MYDCGMEAQDGTLGRDDTMRLQYMYMQLIFVCKAVIAGVMPVQKTVVSLLAVKEVMSLCVGWRVSKICFLSEGGMERRTLSTM